MESAVESPLTEPRALPMHWNRLAILFLVLTGMARALAAPGYGPAGSLQPPAIPREFRGVWVASVKNIDWPSQPGLSTAQQKAELITLLDLAVQLRLNVVFLQVRPACDALYVSSLEPWSEYLTGTMGRAPEPAYDPLGFAIEEAHRRGLELHAWFNPFRARHASSTAALARTHLSQTRPALVKAYGKSLWLDPGEAAARDHSLRVILDVVSRYDLDGVHFDDYFYPYQERDREGRALPFPDGPSWQRYQAGGGKLARDDWRRDNVNEFVRRVRDEVHGRKPWVRFGISPFGIWRPGHPAGVKGLDAYDVLYADARQWIQEGWVDYLAPQLYWAIDAREQSYPALLRWWTEQNPKGRQLFAGLSHRNGAAEVLGQIQMARRQPGVGGHIHWSARSLLQGATNAQWPIRSACSQPALTPAAAWLDAVPPARPRLAFTNAARATVRFQWANGGTEPVRFWAVQSRRGGQWHTEIVEGAEVTRSWPANAAPEVVAVTAVDRAGNTGPAAVLQASSSSSPSPTPAPAPRPRPAGR